MFVYGVGRLEGDSNNCGTDVVDIHGSMEYAMLAIETGGTMNCRKDMFIPILYTYSK